MIHLKDAVFGTDEELRSTSGNLVFLMIERNKASKKLLEALLPKVCTSDFAHLILMITT